MIYKPSSRRALKRQVAINLRNELRAEKLVARALRKEFRRLGEQIASYSGTLTPSVLQIMKSQHATKITLILAQGYRIALESTLKGLKKDIDQIEKKGTSEDFAEALRQAVAQLSAGNPETFLPIASASTELTATGIMEAYVQAQIAVQAARTSVLITETTMASIQREIARSVIDANGNLIFRSTNEIADAIKQSLDGKISSARARMIARTEVHSASMAMEEKLADELLGNTGTQIYKVWLTIVDGNERPSHKHANDQKVKKEEPFSVGGKRMMYPGDRAGGAEEVINCRCQLMYTDNPSGYKGAA